MNPLKHLGPIFSRREKLERGEVPDEYQYETMPMPLRNQITIIVEEVFGSWGDQFSEPESYRAVHDRVREELGHRSLTQTSAFLRGVSSEVVIAHRTNAEIVLTFFLNAEVDEALNVVEASFQYMEEKLRPDAPKVRWAIDRLNQRFREHGVGYQYAPGKEICWEEDDRRYSRVQHGQVIRIDSEMIHTEVMQPAMRMLSDPMYETADKEFRQAHGHYRAGRYKECLVFCNSALESCLKAICDKRGWNYGNQTAKNLIQTVFDKKLIPGDMQSHFEALRDTLKYGVPNVRNSVAHGGGRDVPEYIAGYILHLTSSNILLLSKANEEYKKH